MNPFPKPNKPKGCGNPECGVSTGYFHEDPDVPMSGLTFGSGELDYYGYWSEPCFVCARAAEAANPSWPPCWPYPEESP